MVRLFLGIIPYFSSWAFCIEELDIVLGNAGHNTQTRESATVSLMIAASAITSSSLTRVVNIPDPTMTSPVTEGGATSPIGTAVQQISGSQIAMSRDTIRRAQGAVDTIDAMITWKNAVNAIKWVMDTVSPIAAVCPVSFLFTRPWVNVRCSA
jgi:hypothetical protein